MKTRQYTLELTFDRIAPEGKLSRLSAHRSHTLYHSAKEIFAVINNNLAEGFAWQDLNNRVNIWFTQFTKKSFFLPVINCSSLVCEFVTFIFIWRTANTIRELKFYTTAICIKLILKVDKNDGKNFDTVYHKFCLYSAKCTFDYLLIKYRIIRKHKSLNNVFLHQ